MSNKIFGNNPSLAKTTVQQNSRELSPIIPLSIINKERYRYTSDTNQKFQPNQSQSQNGPTSLKQTQDQQQPPRDSLSGQNLSENNANQDVLLFSLHENSPEAPNQNENQQTNNHPENPFTKPKSTNNSSLSNKPVQEQQQLPQNPEKKLDSKDNPQTNIQQDFQTADNKNQHLKPQCYLNQQQNEYQVQIQKFNDYKQRKIYQYCEDLWKEINLQNKDIFDKNIYLGNNQQQEDYQKCQMRLFYNKKSYLVNHIESEMGKYQNTFILELNQWFEQDRSQYPSKFQTISSSFQERMKNLLEQFIEENKKIEIQEEKRIESYNDQTKEKKLSLINLNNCLKESYEKCQTEEKEIFSILDSLEAEIKLYENSTNNQTNL